MSDLEVSIEDEIAQITMGRPHVVILGAGASRAATPHGDDSGKVLPLMADLVDVVRLQPLISSFGVDVHPGNFEQVFSQLHLQGRQQELALVEGALDEYFEQLRLPPEPTLYDHLILSLRRKDLIATFNWDPLLLQAYRRLGGSAGELPRLAFLHGNVGIGYCAEHRTSGLRDDNCSVCGLPRTRAPLLYPIAEKNYSENDFIANEWGQLEHGLKSGFMVTIFGYSAPNADTAAITAMKDAWGAVERRSLEQIELISIQSEEQLLESWGDFIHTHHYEIHADFYDSWLAKHPRRSGEAYWNQYLEAKFISDNPIPRDASWSQLRSWFDLMTEVEVKSRAAQQS